MLNDFNFCIYYENRTQHYKGNSTEKNRINLCHNRLKSNSTNEWPTHQYAINQKKHEISQVCNEDFSRHDGQHTE